MARKALLTVTGAALALLLFAGPALACGGLVSPNGTVALVRTTTLAAYHNGVEHYVTGFKFSGGGGGKFGSIVPLPGIPSKVIRGGNWTLQRLELEVQPPLPEGDALSAAATPAAAGGVQVILTTKVDALDITVLKGGGFAVGKWARDHGFALPPDAPKLLDFYARRSPIFMTVEFNAKRARARGENAGDAIPVHVVIPTKRPWVPLRILALGAKPNVRVQADVFLLTDHRPSLLPAPTGSFEFTTPAAGLTDKVSEAASDRLMFDLRRDRGMSWMPTSGMWLTFLSLDVQARNLTYDLAIDPTGQGNPSPVDAGLVAPGRPAPSPGRSAVWALWAAVALLSVLFVAAAAEYSGRKAAL